MSTNIDRRTLLKSGAAGGALLLSNPLSALAKRGGAVPAQGYGPLVAQGDLRLPRGFSYEILSRAGDPMTDGNPVPTAFDGMAAFPGPDRGTVLVRNHENRGRSSDIPVVVPADKAYDPASPSGCTKVVLDKDGKRVEEFAILGGTAVNCAGGPTPWGSWLTCEETFSSATKPHGYVFEMDAAADGPVDPEPIIGAGRFSHEAAAWVNGILYLTEDRGDACLYRYIPSTTINGSGQLARSTGRLEALKIVGTTRADTRGAWPVGEASRVEWVLVDNPNPTSESAGQSTRGQAQAKGATIFTRQEGSWAVGEKVTFDCTNGGPARSGQVWQLDPATDELTLLYVSPSADVLDAPDNLCLVPLTGEVLLCEDGAGEQFVRGLTLDGRIYELAGSLTTDSEFCGACFSPDGKTLFLNQQSPGVTYAIRGPWKSTR